MANSKKKKVKTPGIDRVGTHYELTINGKSVDGKAYRNLYIAQQALLTWVSNNTAAVKFEETDITAAQLADDEQPGNSE